MKVYRVVDNCTEALVTFDELKALRLFRKIMEKHAVTWGWIDESEVQ